jgi:hypothetical protein
MLRIGTENDIGQVSIRIAPEIGATAVIISEVVQVS